MQLNELKSPKGSRKRRKMVGRGSGSGHGKTSCRGQKGQRSRSGGSVMLGSEGGQMPLIKRIPKLGFRSKCPILYQVVQLSKLKGFKEGTVIDPVFLKTHGLIKKLLQPYKILSVGDLNKPLTVLAHSFSKTAEEKITKAGGKVEKISISSVRDKFFKNSDQTQS